MIHIVINHPHIFAHICAQIAGWSALFFVEVILLRKGIVKKIRALPFLFLSIFMFYWAVRLVDYDVALEIPSLYPHVNFYDYNTYDL